jgi:hypothetical protein
MNATSTYPSHELVVMICIFVRRKLVELGYMHIQETNNTKTIHILWGMFIRTPHAVYGYVGRELARPNRSSWMHSSVQQDVPSTALYYTWQLSNPPAIGIYPESSALQEMKRTGDHEHGRWNITFLKHEAVTEGTVISRSCGTVIIKSIGESRDHGTSANQASKANQKGLYLDMAI